MADDATVVGGASSSDYVLESDEAAEFWQFLHGMRGDDLLVELIVNDLDAKSPRTVIHFEPERLVCAGAGLPVDQDGWDRLRKIRGAGGIVNAKKGLFGIKNHGLKACFTLGNDIILRSAGLLTVQTLFSRGANAPAYPGALRAPLYDPDGPTAGTTLEVPYRREAFRTQQGETFAFSGMDDATIEAKFLDAVATLPRRLLGIIRPRMIERYTLELHHWRLGQASLDFRCGRWRMSKGAMAFARHCKVSAPPGVDGADVFERGLLAAYDLQDDVERPEFYRAGAYRDAKGKLMFGGKGLVLEAAWPTDKSGALRHHAGRCRYPIAYPGEHADGGTGHDVWFSAPFSSDSARHALGAQSENWNNKLVGKCDDLARRALSEILLPQVGAPALTLIAGLADENRLNTLLNGLLKDRSLPAVGPDRKPTRIAKGSMLLVPTYTWDHTSWSPLLAKVCPPGSVIVSQRTPGTVLARLSREGLDGWGETYHRFDEGDVSDRLRAAEAEHFPWPNRTVWRTALRDPAIAASHLDALEPALAQADTTKRPKPQGVMLPDAHGELTPFEDLRRGLALPDKFLDVPLPPVIHTALRDHRILRSPGWSLEDFTFTDLLHTGDLEAASQAARRRFFGWLTLHTTDVPRDDWTVLKALPIWPATTSTCVPFDALCAPPSRIAAILGPHILKPSREVQALCRKAATSRLRMKVRTDPTPEEVAAFYRARLATFDTTVPLSTADRIAFHAFESQLCQFGQEGRLAAALHALANEALALNALGHLTSLDALLRPTAQIARLALPANLLLDRPAEDLDAVFPPLKRPAWLMVADALRDDPANASALVPRLKAICEATSDPALRRSIQDVACLETFAGLRAPQDLAFKGNAGDFWGRWKISIGTQGLPDDVQELYRSVGVLRGTPDPETARAFFLWLDGQPQAVVEAHVAQVIRHIGRKGATALWLTPPQVACIPVETETGVALLTQTEALKRAFVDDFPRLADEVRDARFPTNIALTIDSVPETTTPIADVLRSLGVRSLRAAAVGPLSATVVAEQTAPPEFKALLASLASEGSAKRLRKQLQERDLPHESLHVRWQKRLSDIHRVRVGVGLRAQFRLGRRTYAPQVEQAVVLDSHELWLEASDDPHAAFFSAIAEVIFAPPVKRYFADVLRAALAAEVRDFHRPTPEVDDLPQGRDDDADPDHTPASGDDDDQAETQQPHPGGEPDPSLNTPKPGPIYRGGTGRVRKPSKSTAPPRPQHIDEDVQRRELKQDHYAWHCQIELAKASPATLSPAGSYTEFQENRSKLIEAHHPDKVGSGGPRNAGNLLILSHLNHERIGRAISRQQITDALKAECPPRSILAADGTRWVDGVVAHVQVPATGEVVGIFFTLEHRRYWLEMSGVEGPL
jgi:hypothetical protein